MGRVFLIILNDVVNHGKAIKIHLEMGILNHLRQNWGLFVIGLSRIRLRDSKKSSMIMIGLATLVAVYLLVSLPSCNQNMAVENPSSIDDFHWFSHSNHHLQEIFHCHCPSTAFFLGSKDFKGLCRNIHWMWTCQAIQRFFISFGGTPEGAN